MWLICWQGNLLIKKELKNVRKKNISFWTLLLVASPMILGGCIGSQFVVDDTDNKAEFPRLHDVPQRPDLPDRSDYTELKNDLSDSQQKILEENERLRKQHGL